MISEKQLKSLVELTREKEQDTPLLKVFSTDWFRKKYIEAIMANYFPQGQALLLWAYQEAGLCPSVVPNYYDDSNSYSQIFKGCTLKKDISEAKKNEDYDALFRLLEYDKIFLLEGWVQYIIMKIIGEHDRKKIHKIGKAIGTVPWLKKIRSSETMHKLIIRVSKTVDFNIKINRCKFAELAYKTTKDPKKEKVEYLEEDKQFFRYLKRHKII